MKRRPQAAHPSWRQAGVAMIEFAVVGPLLALMGLAILQYGMLFFAKNQLNHASFIAARAGSMGNARFKTVRDAYVGALVPLYGGGRNEVELTQARDRADADMSHVDIALLNPTRESFLDWSDPALEQKYQARAIPNSNLAFKDPGIIKTNSGQNIQDANLLKLRITHGYAPKVPLMGLVYTTYLNWFDPKNDPLYTRLVKAGRIPVVSHVTVQMQSDAVEDGNVSTPGLGNGGKPVNPGDPVEPDIAPPNCLTIGCTTQGPPLGGGGGDGSGVPCPGLATVQTLMADLSFEFGKSVLTAAGKTALDDWIATARNKTFASVTLTGYTDQLATPGFDNNKLSLDRANAVRDYLQSHGFPAKPIATRGQGAQSPRKLLSDCPPTGQAQKDCLAPNRRVEIMFAN
ncbi:MAG: hypothetical protein JWP36_687 [Paucimonas sp.]|nr:hypothetical protein [Paucimonas sp.]